MPSTASNALNITSAGLVKFDGVSTFTGVPLTQHDVLVGGASNSITNVAPSATSGVPLVSNGAGADPSFTTMTVAGGGTGDTSLTAYAVLTGGTTSTNPIQSIASVGTPNQMLTSNGASTLPSFQEAAFAPNSIVKIVDDFFSCDKVTNTNGSSVLISDYCWAVFNTGITILNPTITNTNPGILGFGSLGIGGVAGILLINYNTSGQCIILGSGAITLNWIIKLGALSTSTSRYTFACGLNSTSTSGNPAIDNDTIYFAYTDNVNSGNFTITCKKAGTPTTNNTSTAASATGYHNFGITIDAAATSVGFFYDGVQVANSPIATNIPIVALRPFCNVGRNVGTIASPSLNIDAFYFQQILTTPR